MGVTEAPSSSPTRLKISHSRNSSVPVIGSELLTLVVPAVSSRV